MAARSRPEPPGAARKVFGDPDYRCLVTASFLSLPRYNLATDPLYCGDMFHGFVGKIGGLSKRPTPPPPLYCGGIYGF